MSKIKTSYRVKNTNILDIEEEIKGYIIKFLSDNKDESPLSLSIRVTHRTPNKSKQTYATLMYINSENISEIMSYFNSRLLKRNIDIMCITGIHLHLHTF